MGFNHRITRAGLRVARDRAYDVVHAHDWLVAHAAQTLREALELPLVVTVHATEAGRHQGWLPGPLNRAIHAVEWWLVHAAARVITCSAHMRWEVARLFGVPGSRLAVIPNGIDLAEWRAPAEAVAAARAEYGADGPLLVFSGRLVWEKGAHTLLEAVPRLRRRHPGLRVVIAGDGHGREKLEALADPVPGDPPPLVFGEGNLLRDQ
ncbi:glycosyltransferase family 4 protein [Carbonactinospora thermoautotrophica]|uniref:glycosyltransferase family 4 protein n=1 Tax=Carbonactinospora thermoautotrophica TaxID=1469144 RepID=UPI00226F56E4|nr:glycosyltransferase family 4 protein [Carbonactinospora thermoautotrophica]